MNPHAPFGGPPPAGASVRLFNLTGQRVWFGYEDVVISPTPHVLKLRHVDSSQPAPPPDILIGDRRVPVLDEGAKHGLLENSALHFITEHPDACILVTPDVGYCFWFYAPWFRGRVFSHAPRDIDKALRLHRKPVM